MNKRMGYEFIATIDNDGNYECNDSPITFPVEPIIEVKDSSDLEMDINNKNHLDVNKIFFESYNSNFKMDTNELLRDAQKNLIDMQKTILENLKL